jgi:hypothetical protein
MFVYVSNKRSAWVGSVFQYSADALAWWESVPEDRRTVLEGLEQPGLEYPFLIIEWFPKSEWDKKGPATSNAFEFVSMDEGEELLRDLHTTIERTASEGKPRPGADVIFCNVYVLREDYSGDPVGTAPGLSGPHRRPHEIDQGWLGYAVGEIEDWDAPPPGFPWRK